MSGIIVSVIAPFLESNNKLIDTLSSISEQKNINQENIEVLIVDATDKTSGKIASGSMSMCKVIYAKSVKSFADACNLAASKATGKYITVCNCGDTFSDNYFESCIKVFNEKEKIPFVAGHRFCVNPVFRAVAFGVGDDNRLAAFQNSNTGIGSTEVDTDVLCQ